MKISMDPLPPPPDPLLGLDWDQNADHTPSSFTYITLSTLDCIGRKPLAFSLFSGATESAGDSIVLQEAQMDVLSDADCTAGWGSDVVPNNLDICVRDDNFGGDTQICYVRTLKPHLYSQMVYKF